MGYFISPPVKSDWKIRPSDFKAHLLTRCPGITVEDLSTSKFFSYMWSLRMRAGEVEGRFFQDGRGVVLDGDLADCAAFATWFRSLVPSQQKLWFYDESFSAYVDLTPDSSAASIVASFKEIWRRDVAADRSRT